jgi:hypothetical protein
VTQLLKQSVGVCSEGLPAPIDAFTLSESEGASLEVKWGGFGTRASASLAAASPGHSDWTIWGNLT